MGAMPHMTLLRRDFREAALVRLFAKIAEAGGSDVRLELGAVYRPKAWPRAPLYPQL